jgi:hypothetical protein
VNPKIPLLKISQEEYIYYLVPAAQKEFTVPVPDEWA